MLNKLRPYISPFFLTRYYTRRDIAVALRSYQFKGRILDFGCGDKPNQSLFKDASSYEGIDFKDFSRNRDFEAKLPEHFFDDEYTKTWHLPFPNEQFDNVVSFQVLEHHANVAQMFSEIARITKPGGYLMISAPFLGGLHEVPHDYQRLTEFAVKNLLEANGYELLQTTKEGSIFSTVVMLYNEYINSLAARGKTAYILVAILLHPFGLLGSYISILADRLFISKNIFFNYLFVAQKSSIKQGENNAS